MFSIRLFSIKKYMAQDPRWPQGPYKKNIFLSGAQMYQSRLKNLCPLILERGHSNFLFPDGMSPIYGAILYK